jgi:hypothetical protein
MVDVSAGKRTTLVVSSKYTHKGCEVVRRTMKTGSMDVRIDLTDQVRWTAT